MQRFLPISLLVATAIMAAAPAANAASGGPTREVVIESWSLEAPKSTAGSSGLSAGKVSYSDLSVMIALEKASPLLNLAVAEGKHIDTLELTFRAPAALAGGGEQQDYYKVTLQDVMVSSYQTSAHTTGFSLNYAKIAFTGKTMAAEVLASAGGANFAFSDGSVRFVR